MVSIRACYVYPCNRYHTACHTAITAGIANMAKSPNGKSGIIIATIKNVLENAPPELAGDIVERGIVLTGGGALLTNLDLLIKAETGLPVAIADNPLSVVVRGAAMALDHIDVLRAAAS